MEYRRNLLTREWVVFGPEILSPETFLKQANPYQHTSDLFDEPSGPCPYCPENITSSHVDIFSSNESDLPAGGFPVESISHARDWDIKVLPAVQPVFKIETAIQRFPRRLHDVMEAPGAHEKFILTPAHGEAIWDFPVKRIELLLHILRHRMLNLYRDPRLGHQHAYMVFGKDFGSLYAHSVLNLTALPFIPLIIQRELDGAQEWYRMKERCLFSDIYEDEMYKRDTGKPHGILFVSVNYIALIPFFSGHPFEIWIMPLDQQSDYTQTLVQHIPELARIIHRIIIVLRSVLGPYPYVLSLMTQPNEAWGNERGYWTTIHRDWLWRMKLVPGIPVMNSPLKAFHTGTGIRLNPVLPEDAAAFLRQKM
jgi:UDPglucose--hexose-1-phosphate uridylyltransferase